MGAVGVVGSSSGDAVRPGLFLYAGGGLVEEGLRGLVTPKLAVEWDARIAAVHAAAHPGEVLVEDVYDVPWSQIPGPFCYLHASPVCKSVSLARRERGERESDRCGAEAIVSAITEYEPGVVTVENVPQYVDTWSYRQIIDRLDALGYRHDSRVYDASDYGVASRRPRMLLRAVRWGSLPPPPAPMPRVGWYETVADLIDELPDDELPGWVRGRLEHHGIDPTRIDRPLYVAGGSTSANTVPHAWGDQPAPVIKATAAEKARILVEGAVVLPNGRAKHLVIIKGVSPRRSDGARVLARLVGLPDSYPLPDDPVLASTIIGNGVPPPLARAVFGPLVPSGLADAALVRAGIDPASVSVVVTELAARAPRDCTGNACTRQYAYTRDLGDERYELGVAPKLLRASAERVAGIVAHEIGHMLLMRAGQDHHTEREADEAAETALNVRISYDGDDVQTVARGTRPRPAHLG
jgi:DNA (cytosine-5)-methyltransferase 1